jgi:hypothetical protein
MASSAGEAMRLMLTVMSCRWMALPHIAVHKYLPIIVNSRILRSACNNSVAHT